MNPRLIYHDSFKAVMRDIDSMRWYNVAMSGRGPDNCISPAAFRGHGFVYTHNFCYVYKKVSHARPRMN